jgi:beta-fructofuranosidase
LPHALAGATVSAARVTNPESPVKSTTPRQHFAGDLATQEQQLENDVLLARFRASRAGKAQDRYRPYYHFSPPENGLNDPNGLCFWQGNWHLFYQGYPVEGRVHWGHAISTDLIHWRDLPYAIYPDTEENCFSGTTFVEEDRVIAAFYGHQGEAGLMIATASDPLLLNWEVLTGKAVIRNIDYDELGRPHQVYDPCIWKDGEFYYVLCGGWADGINPLAEPHAHNKVGADDATPGRMVDHLYRSRDLQEWVYMGQFMERDLFGFSGDDGSCPYFWPIGAANGEERHVLLTFSHVHAAMYVVGDYDRERQRFVARRGGYLNSGRQGGGSIHAPSAFPDGQGGVHCLYNVTEGRPQQGWSQIMSLPRTYTLGADDRLLMQPAGDVESLRREAVELSDIALPANEEVVVEQVRGDALEIVARIEPGASRLLSLRVLRAPDLSEYTAIHFHREAGKDWANRSWGVRDSIVTIDPTFATTSGEGEINVPQSCAVPYVEGEPIELRLFVDRSIVEVFVNGSACLTRVYPEGSESVGFSMTSRGQDALCRSLSAWTMERVFL